VGNDRKEVAIGVAMPRCVFHNNPIPTEYAKVLAREITDMEYTDYPLDHVTPEGVKELRQAINQFILQNQREIFLDGSISPQKQHIQLNQTPTLSPVNHILVTPSGQQAAQQFPSPYTEQEASQQPLQSSPKDKETSQQPLPSSPIPKVKEAPQLPSPPTESGAPKDREASPVQVMPPPSSSPYDTIHEDLGLYKATTRSDPTNQFFVKIKNLKSPSGTSSVMSALVQHAETYMRACRSESYGQDVEVYNLDKLLMRQHDPIFMKKHVPEKFVFGKPFFTSAHLFKRPFPLRRLHNWYLITSSLCVTNITFEIPGNVFYSGARIGSIDFRDLWFMFHQKWLDMNFFVVFCL
jgi:hypothetical protein